jgi:hypothetical protein
MDKIAHHDEIIISDITITADPCPREAMNNSAVVSNKVQSSTVITTKTSVKTQEQG